MSKNKQDHKLEKGAPSQVTDADYDSVLTGMVELLEQARRTAVRTVNSVMTATYWEIGHRIVEFEQGGKERAAYGEQLLVNLGSDLTQRFGRGFGWRNLFQMRSFYLTYQNILQTPSAISGNIDLTTLARNFPLNWSHYVLLLACQSKDEREFYETETLRGGWTVRQLKRQMNSAFFTRILLSKNKAAMLKKGEKGKPEDLLTPEEEIKDPFVLEFLNLKDEYSEKDLEDALIRHLEEFLMELGTDFCFIARQKRLRIGDTWFRIDLLFFHRKLKCLLVIDLKLGNFSHEDVGQMNLYLNYAKEHWMNEGENPPVGLILCEKKSDAIAHYALDSLSNKILAAEYKTVLPDEKLLVDEMVKTRRLYELHLADKQKKSQV